MRQKVITVHGVNPDPWQDDALRILEPHFDCAKYEYHEYDGPSGPLKVFCHPKVLGGAVVGLVAAVGATFASCWTLAAELSGASFVLLICGAIVASVQRRTCAKQLKAYVAQVSRTPPWPHFVAHSFGTYLVGQVIRHPDISVNRVALVGSVLPRRYGWRALLEGRRSAFREIRNETATGDWVVWLAGKSRWMAWDIGDAGRRGFQVADGVHQTSGPWAPCPECASRFGEGIVHNVPLGELAHSDVFLGPTHAQRLWLPFFWGIPPDEFDDYVSLCWDAAFYLHEGYRWQFEVVLEALAESRWRWNSHQRLADVVEGVLEHEAIDAGLEWEKVNRFEREKLVWATLARMSNYIVAACEEDAAVAARRGLYPLWALVRASRRTVREAI